ncbi:Fc.00g110540.m01.CDS01 [Cosmosporella sp. VM-42]
MPIAHGARRNTMSKSAAARAAIVGSLPSPPASLPSHHKSIADVKRELHGSAIEDDPNDVSADEGATNKFQKARVRRASDGQPLMKEGKKSNRVEVRCDKCGKGYKHSSCLTKHFRMAVACDDVCVNWIVDLLARWEHTPEWSYTSKLLISKHQQVQLLEAASVLVAMNGKESATTPPDSAKDFPSEAESSSSPAASGYSDQVERQSSADTTPPPQIEGVNVNGTSYRNKRFSGNGFSRSYQSAPLATSYGNGNSVSYGSGFGHFRQPSNEHRPTSSGRNATGQDDRDLAAAVELLSCSFGSNNGSRTVTLPADAPPVPPLPAQYLDQATPLTNTGFINSFPSRQPESFTRGEVRRSNEDVKTDESGDSVMDDDDFDMRSRARSDEDDDGVFGRMEE